MNPIVRLILAGALGLAWYVVTRAYAPNNRLNKEDPAGFGQRREISRALQAMAFLGLVWFILSTIVLFIFSLVLALVAPPNQRGFGEAFGELLNSATGSSGPLSPLSLGGAVAQVIATVGAVWLTQRVARGKSLFDLGLRPYPALPFDLVLGLILGPLLFAMLFQAENVLGYLVGVSGPSFGRAWELSQWLLVFLCVAVSEELVVRGFFLQVINEVWGGTAAVVTTSVFWGFAHLLNPRATLLGVFNIIVAGLVFAYAYNITGRLWLPIFFHFSWNFAQGAIFGYPVSGYVIEPSVFQPFVNGPSEITGGLFGPEGGLLSLFAIILGGLILYGWERSRRPSQPQKQ